VFFLFNSAAHCLAQGILIFPSMFQGCGLFTSVLFSCCLLWRLLFYAPLHL
jgi:hypothetical protein